MDRLIRSKVPQFDGTILRTSDQQLFVPQRSNIVQRLFLVVAMVVRENLLPSLEVPLLAQSVPATCEQHFVV